MLTFCRYPNLSSGSALHVAPGPAGAFCIGAETGRGGQTPTPYSCLTSSMTNVLSIELMFSCLPSTFSRSCW